MADATVDLKHDALSQLNRPYTITCSRAQRRPLLIATSFVLLDKHTHHHDRQHNRARLCAAVRRSVGAGSSTQDPLCGTGGLSQAISSACELLINSDRDKGECSLGAFATTLMFMTGSGRGDMKSNKVFVEGARRPRILEWQCAHSGSASHDIFSLRDFLESRLESATRQGITLWGLSGRIVPGGTSDVQDRGCLEGGGCQVVRDTLPTHL